MIGDNDDTPVEEKVVLRGVPPSEVPPKSVAYDELQKKIVDVLVDAIKYIASSCGIAIALYSQILQGYLRDNKYIPTASAKGLLVTPLLLWLMVIFSTIAGIFPRNYEANTDWEKQTVVQKINRIKKKWLIISLSFFFAGFVVFVYIICSQIWNLFPFH